MRGAARPWGGLVPSGLGPAPAFFERRDPDPAGVDALPEVPRKHTYAGLDAADTAMGDAPAEAPEIQEILLFVLAGVLALGLLGRLVGGSR